MYGVDQCRVCGIRIPPLGPDQAEEQMKVNRKPIIPEQEWRRMGLLTSPTRPQLNKNPALGCCGPCGLKQIKKKSKPGTRGFLILFVGVGIAIFVISIITFLPH